MKRNMLWVGVIIMILLSLWGVEELRSRRLVPTVTNESESKVESRVIDDVSKEVVDKTRNEATRAAKLAGEGNFRQIGTLINYDSTTETESDSWRLLYDKPGSSVRQVNLLFENNSECKKSGVLLNCGGTQLMNGDRVELVGVITGEDVEVVNIQRASAE